MLLQDPGAGGEVQPHYCLGGGEGSTSGDRIQGVLITSFNTWEEVCPPCYWAQTGASGSSTKPPLIPGVVWVPRYQFPCGFITSRQWGKPWLSTMSPLTLPQCQVGEGHIAAMWQQRIGFRDTKAGSRGWYILPEVKVLAPYSAFTEPTWAGGLGCLLRT